MIDGNDDEHADEVLGLDRFEELLPLTDYLVLSLPDSPQTRDIINADILQKINSSSFPMVITRSGSNTIYFDLKS